MDETGAFFLILALALLVGMVISRPFLGLENEQEPDGLESDAERKQQAGQLRSTLLAESDQLLSALQELDFDYNLGKVPAEDYPPQRAELAHAAAEALRRLDELSPAAATDKAYQAPAPPEPVVVEPVDEALDLAIAAHRRSRLEKAIGFCPKCGKPVKKSDKFCSRCGMPITL
jgi:predicted nucleic acid-binding Zn ribbon protein